MNFKEYLREEEKKKAKKKATKKKDTDGATSGTGETVGNVGVDEVVPGAVMGNVMNVQQPPVTNLGVVGNNNMEAYNSMRAFAMGMENNMSGITLLKNHPTPEIAEQATILERDAKAIIQYIMAMQIPVN